MNTFTASNDIVVKSYEDNRIEIKCSGSAASTHNLSVSETEALREFFRAEEDERFGRWRSKGHPEYMVTRKTRDELVIAHEDGRWWYYNRGADQPTTADLAAVAREFFDAHPEPEPWDDAKPGDVWVFEMNNGEVLVGLAVRRASGVGFKTVVGDTLDVDCLGMITGGRRIWPEDAA